jgi:drug/metabolite transporter (DMT)-like permease
MAPTSRTAPAPAPAPAPAASPARAGGALGLLLVVGGLLSVSVVLAKAAALVGWPPLAYLQWSILGGAVIQAFGNGLWRVRARPARPVLTYALVSGALFALPNALAFAAAPHVGAGFVALCFAFPLVLTYGMAVGLGLDRLRWTRLAGVGAGLAGAVLLGASGEMRDPDTVLWVLAALAVPVVISVGNIYRTFAWPKGAQPSHLSTGMMAAGFVTMAVLNLALGTDPVPAQWTPAAVAILAGQILLFAVRYDLYFRLQHAAGPVYLSQIGSVGAVIGLALAFVAFGEVPGLRALLAAGCVGLGVLLVSRRASLPRR